MRQRHHAPLLAAAAVAGLLAAASPARADHVDFSVGATFPVGHGIVSLMIGQPAYGYGNRYPAYGRSWESQPFYFRVATPIHAHGVHCSTRCYTRGGYGYHHPSCPALHAYFDGYNVHPSGHWPYSSWAPDWGSYGWRAPSYRAPRYSGSYGYPYQGYRNDGRRYDDRRYSTRPYDGRRYEGRRHDGRWRDRDGRWRDRDDRDRHDRDHRDRHDRHDRGDWRDRD